MKNSKYIINDKTLNVPRFFNEKLDLNDRTLKDVTTLIFEEDWDRAKYSHFNQPIVLTPNIRIVRFGQYFNQPIDLTSQIMNITFGCYFNQPIVLTPCVKFLTFGLEFDQPIILTPNIEILIFKGYFNQPIILTSRITVLTFGTHFNQPIILTPNIRMLTLGFYFNQPIVLTSGIKYLKICCNNHGLIENLPNNIKYLTVGYGFCLPLNNIPHSVEKIMIEDWYNYKYKHLIPKNLIKT